MNRAQTDSASTTVDQRQLARANLREHPQVGPYRARNLNDPRGLLKTETLRKRKDLSLRHCNKLRIAATGKQTTHLVAFSEAGIARVDNNAGTLQPHDLTRAGRWRIVASRLQEVASVNTRGLDPDEGFAWRKLGIVNLRHVEGSLVTWVA